MEVFQSQMIIYKNIGIKRHPSSQMKKYFFLLKIWNSFAILFVISTAAVFSATTKDIREIAESMGPAFTALVMMIKYAIFSLRTEVIFTIMDDIKELNEKCKKFSSIFFSVLNFFKFLDKHLKNAEKIVSKANNLVVRITTPLKWGCIIAATFYIVKPLSADFIYYFLYDIQPSRGVPFKAKFFYDETKLPAYLFTYFIQSYTAIIVGTIVVSMESFWINLILDINYPTVFDVCELLLIYSQHSSTS
jgi:hypothetical protein